MRICALYEVTHGLILVQDCYVSFLLMIRQWRYLKMLKRGGRGNIPEGATAVPPGSCAVECPACPHPGKNLPDDWKDAPASKSYVVFASSVQPMLR